MSSFAQVKNGEADGGRGGGFLLTLSRQEIKEQDAYPGETLESTFSLQPTTLSVEL